MGELERKHVVVTGATGALGDAVVHVLLAQGAVCHLPMVEAEVPERATWGGHPAVRATGRISLDDESMVSDWYRSLPPLWASIHLAGGFAWGPIEDATLEDLRRMWSINVVTCWLCCREAIRAMPGPGRIVNVAARQVIQPQTHVGAYAATKGAVAALTTNLAVEVQARGILVNAVVPSILDTPANRASMPNADPDRWPKPAEVADTIAFLASPRNAVTSGALVPVFGRA